MRARPNRGRNQRHYTYNHDHQNGRLGPAGFASLNRRNLTEGHRVVITLNYPIMHGSNAKLMPDSRGGCNDDAIARFQNPTVIELLG
jgi:hypothetical protein